MRRRLTTLVAMAVMAAMMLAMAMPAFAVKEETLVVCHVTPTGEVKELNVPFRALGAHIGHGDFVGPCLAG